MAADDVEFGHVVDLTLGEPSGTELVANAAIGATTLTVDYAGDFEDAGEVSLNGAVLPYTAVTYGAAETDPDVITLAAPLAAAAVVDDKVVRMSGGEQVADWLLHVSLGDGDAVDIPIPYEQRAMWSSVDPSTPIPVLVSADLERLVEVPGRTPQIDAGLLDPESTIPPAALTDGNAPTAATTVTPIGGIGSMFYRWTEVANDDPVTYRLHVRAGSAPTTTGIYEVAAGVGLTSASVRKLADGTAIVGDGTVTYHAIVTVEDADGPGPASTDVTGIPAQVTGPDIAVGAITTDDLVFNSGWGVELSGETITGTTVQTAASGSRWVMSGSPQYDLRGFTGAASETFPGYVRAADNGTWLSLSIVGPSVSAYTPPRVDLASVPGTGTYVQLTADHFYVQGLTDATMADGSVGTGTFRTSVDARVTAVAPTVTMTTGAVGTGTFRDSVRSAVMGDYAAGAWTAYTPTFTATTTNPTLGSFTRIGRYTQRGKTVTFTAVITATAGTGLGAGSYAFGLPVTARSSTGPFIGDEVIVTANQTGPNHNYIGRGGGSVTEVTLFLTSTDAVMNPANSGMALGTSIRISGTYEAA